MFISVQLGFGITNVDNLIKKLTKVYTLTYILVGQMSNLGLLLYHEEESGNECSPSTCKRLESPTFPSKLFDI